MRILVTGGAGYVGSHCVRAACDAGHTITVLDNLSKGHRQAVDSRAKLAVADLADAAAVRRLFGDGRFDAVMHFAALAEVGESVRDPLVYYRVNVANTVGLLEAMQDHGVRNFVFSSSCAVYGVPPAVPITEDMPKAPINPYGRTKLAIEWLLEDCAAAWGLRATALRYFNAAGAAADGSIGEDHTPESHLIPRVLHSALGKVEKSKSQKVETERHEGMEARRGEGVTIFGDDYDTPDGTCVRDYVHVEDLAAIHRIAIERTANDVGSVNAESRMANGEWRVESGESKTANDASSGSRSGPPGGSDRQSPPSFLHRCVPSASFQAFNVGTGRGASVREILAAARQITGCPIPAEVGPRRPGDPPALIADPSAVRSAFGWTPRYTDIRSIIATAWQWRRTHPDGFA